LHDPLGQAGWNLGLLAGPVFTDRRYNRYFYEVAPQYATASRAAYSPEGGFAGTQFIAALSKRFQDVWVGGFIRYDTLRGARFEDSPLVTSKKYVAGGIGFAWVLGRSSQRVKVTDYGDDAR
jgi:MipA family protein